MGICRGLWASVGICRDLSGLTLCDTLQSGVGPGVFPRPIAISLGQNSLLPSGRTDCPIAHTARRILLFYKRINEGREEEKEGGGENEGSAKPPLFSMCDEYLAYNELR